MQQPNAQHRIIIEPSATFRSMGRQLLQNKFTQAVLATLVALLLLRIPTIIIDNLFGTTVDLTQNPDFIQTLHDMGMTDSEIQSLSLSYKVSPISTVYMVVMTGPFMMGLMGMFLKIARGGEPVTGDVFNGFSSFAKALGVFCWMSLLIMGWFLLPIAANLAISLLMPTLAAFLMITVPLGLILALMAAFSYSQAYFLITDYPDLGVVGSVKVSKMLMHKNRNKYLALSLSYIGWLILAAIASAIITGIGAMVSTQWVIAMFFSAVALIPTAAVTTYIYTGYAAFHEGLVGNIQVQSILDGDNGKQPYM